MGTNTMNIKIICQIILTLWLTLQLIGHLRKSIEKARAREFKEDWIVGATMNHFIWFGTTITLLFFGGFYEV